MSYVFIPFGLILYVRLSTCCQSSPSYSNYYSPPDIPTTTTTTTLGPETTEKFKSKDDAIRNSAAVFGGFAVPQDMLSQWQNWVAEYKLKRKEEEEAGENNELYKTLHGPGSGFPVSWQGLGPGYAGSPPEEPPPWGYKPVNTGLPALCYDFAQKGPCRETHIRWGYNAYLEICQEFLYSGCGGNFNNFKTKLLCDKHCSIVPSSGCDAESTIQFEDFIGIEDIRRDNNRRKCNN